VDDVHKTEFAAGRGWGEMYITLAVRKRGSEQRAGRDTPTRCHA
jgi:hypothetical protein